MQRDYDNRIFYLTFGAARIQSGVCSEEAGYVIFLFMNIYARAPDSSSFQPAMAQKINIPDCNLCAGCSHKWLGQGNLSV